MGVSVDCYYGSLTDVDPALVSITECSSKLFSYLLWATVIYLKMVFEGGCWAKFTSFDCFFGGVSGSLTYLITVGWTLTEFNIIWFYFWYSSFVKFDLKNSVKCLSLFTSAWLRKFDNFTPSNRTLSNYKFKDIRLYAYRPDSLQYLEWVPLEFFTGPYVIF